VAEKVLKQREREREEEIVFDYSTHTIAAAAPFSLAHSFTRSPSIYLHQLHNH
jgi:hypothetical protein